mmetsp:Transcript_15894/g.40402  ORF Transcript_15894/g.40402 Transcript_15894/m.40402 type:complete len:245 (+) Transcript_15894:55-789(+)
MALLVFSSIGNHSRSRITCLLLCILSLACTVSSSAASSSSSSSSSSPFDVVWDVAYPNLGKDVTKRIVIRVHPEWAPLGAARFRELAEKNFYKGTRFFRVVPNFVAQIGIHGNPDVSKQWRDNKIQDDPAVPNISNKRGTVTFAKSGENTRTTQIFINFSDNGNLDSMGFPPFGEVVEGMDAVDAINQEYGESPQQGMIQEQGSRYLKTKFPKLTYVKTTSISTSLTSTSEESSPASGKDEDDL